MLRFPISNLVKNVQSHFQPHIHTTATRLKSGENRKKKKEERERETKRSRRSRVKGGSPVGGACVTVRLVDQDVLISNL